MLQNAIGWGFLGWMSGETLQIVVRNRRFGDYRELTWFGLFCMTAGIMRGWYGQDIVTILRNYQF